MQLVGKKWIVNFGGECFSILRILVPPYIWRIRRENMRWNGTAGTKLFLVLTLFSSTDFYLIQF